MVAPSPQSSSGETPLRPTLPLRLGRFLLCEELGAGGMATVYLARMELAAGLERLVALKTIHPHLAKEKAFVDMFLDEARIASHVSHPNVCAVHDFGEMNGVYYLAMEHLLGEPLFDVINRLVDRFDEVREVLPFMAARVIADACEGLHAAHTARGPDGSRLSIVHRDVSPQNLFVTYDGAIKVVDFGCAKAAQRVAHTSTGVMKGKVGYAAPEQLRGADDVDARADVWALGVCLWEALTLSPLFTKDTAMGTAMSVLEGPIPLASEDRSWVPERVAKIAQKALERDRDARYASAREMGRDLRKFIADSGFTLESAELAEWMDFLFDERHEEREQQAARVREMDASNVANALPEALSDVTGADVELLPESSSSLAIIEREPEPEDSTPPPLPRETPSRVSTPTHETPPARSSRRRWLVALFVLAALGVGGYYLQLYYEPAPWLLELVNGPQPADDTDLPTSAAHPLLDGSTPDAALAQTDEASSEHDAGEGEHASAGSEHASDPPSSGEETAAHTSEHDAPSTGEARRRSRDRGAGVVTTVVSGGGDPYGGYGGGNTVSPLDPPPRDTPPPPSQGSGGFVEISTTNGGWADVYLGAQRLGRTPLRRELPVGHHRLRVMPFGQEPSSMLIVDIEPGVDQRLEIEVHDPSAQ